MPSATGPARDGERTTPASIRPTVACTDAAPRHAAEDAQHLEADRDHDGSCRQRQPPGAQPKRAVGHDGSPEPARQHADEREGVQSPQVVEQLPEGGPIAVAERQGEHAAHAHAVERACEAADEEYQERHPPAMDCNALARPAALLSGRLVPGSEKGTSTASPQRELPRKGRPRDAGMAVARTRALF
jgi:hypothetical protein